MCTPIAAIFSGVAPGEPTQTPGQAGMTRPMKGDIPAAIGFEHLHPLAHQLLGSRQDVRALAAATERQDGGMLEQQKRVRNQLASAGLAKELLQPEPVLVF